MENCPTCGMPVSSVFEHVDESCETWTHRVTWTVDGEPCEYRGTEQAVREMRRFMLNISPLKRDNISQVLEVF